MTIGRSCKGSPVQRTVADIAVKFTEYGSITAQLAVQETLAGGRVIFKFSVTHTGIGLAISKRLAEMMNCSIGVTSEPGRGSTFWVRFELRRPEEQAATLAEQISSVAPAQGSRILVAGDNPVNWKIMKHVLSRLACRYESSRTAPRRLRESGCNPIGIWS